MFIINLIVSLIIILLTFFVYNLPQVTTKYFVDPYYNIKILWVYYIYLKAYDKSIYIEETGTYNWDGVKYNSTFDNDIIISEMIDDNSYVLTDLYGNKVEINKKVSCWDFLFN